MRFRRFSATLSVHADCGAVAWERADVHLSRDVHGRRGVIGLRDQQGGGVPAVARPLHVQCGAVHPPALHATVDAVGHTLHPRLARVADVQVHAGMEYAPPRNANGLMLSLLPLGKEVS